jgi:hypothetical protein
MHATPKVHEAVKEVVLAWAKATDLKEAAVILRDGRMRLHAEQVDQLRRFVAQIAVESLAELMLRATVPAASKPVQFHGVALHPAQVSRLKSWLRDQEPTALALGVSLQVWRHTLDQFVTSHAGADHSGGEDSRAGDHGPITHKQMRRFLGEGLAEGYAPIEAEDTERDRGVSLLSLRKQQKKDKV